MAQDLRRMFSGEELRDCRVAFLMANEGVEQSELTVPFDALGEAGAVREIIAPETGAVQAFNHLDKADTFEVDRKAEEAATEDYDILVMPGGVANPDRLRLDRSCVSFVRSFFQSGKLVAAICHAPWMLVEADVVRGRRLTSWPSLRTDIQNAGGEWVDEQAVVDGNLVTSRKPDDLEAFTRAIVDWSEEHRKAA